jgi:PTS system nitrogen regulatory IIA component
LLRRGGLWRDVPASEVRAVFEQVLRRLPVSASALLELVVRRLREPRGVTWAPVGEGFALPHPAARPALGPDSGCVAALWLREPLAAAQPAPDAVPVTRLLFFLAPTPRAHLDLLARLSRALRGGPLREALLAGAADEAVYLAARAADARLVGGAADRGTNGGGR